VRRRCMMICGFNPFSGWARGAVRPVFRRPAFPPQTRRMLSERRMRDWMALLDFEWKMCTATWDPCPSPGAPEKWPTARCARASTGRGARWTAGAYLLKGTQARTDPHPGSPAPPGSPTGSRAGGGGDFEVGFQQIGIRRYGHERRSRFYTDGCVVRQSGSGRLGGLIGRRQGTQGGLGRRNRHHQ